MKLINRNGRTETPIEGKDYLTTEGQFSNDSNKHYFTAGGKATKGSDEPPTPPLTYTIELPDTTNAFQMYLFNNSLGDEVVYAPVLESGEEMFKQSSITSFIGDLPKMTYGKAMFMMAGSLASFEGDLSALENGWLMFQNCGRLTSFTSDQPSLTSGSCMFGGCGRLTSFTGDLPSLTNGEDMFHNCRLDLESVNHIANSVPTHTSGTHKIKIGVDVTQVTQEQQDEANAILESKGWTVTWERK